VKAFAPEERRRDSVELIDATAAGDERAFEELRSRYRRAVERICRTIVGTAVLEDCVQEVFVRIWRKAHLFDPRRGSPTAWVLTVARNVARSQRPAAAPAELADDDLEAAPSNPADEVWLRDALAQLPEMERRVVELAYFDDLTQPEIARALQAPLGTVKSWNRRGLNRLADLLEEHEL
jgi:RNA polymerase sigma-70 factor (ECF subfamily)